MKVPHGCLKQGGGGWKHIPKVLWKCFLALHTQKLPNCVQQPSGGGGRGEGTFIHILKKGAFFRIAFRIDAHNMAEIHVCTNNTCITGEYMAHLHPQLTTNKLLGFLYWIKDAGYFSLVWAFITLNLDERMEDLMRPSPPISVAKCGKLRIYTPLNHPEVL